jgi:hypothetical protein
MDGLVAIHSWLRWLVLLAGAGTLLVGLAGWLGSAATDKLGRQVMLAYALSIDAQVLLGIGIWFGEQRWAGGGRQFQFEHPILMLIALVVVHVAAARARRNTGLWAARTRALGAALSLALILIGIPR